MKLLVAIGVAAVVAVVLIVAVAGGSEGSDAPEEVVGVGQVRVGSVAPLAQCSDWVDGTVEERQATIDDIQAQLNQPGADGPTPDLPDEEAYEVFEGACGQDYAVGFRLYKLYARAAAFGTILE